MGNFDKNVFSSTRQDYPTPQYLFDILDKEFHFTTDVCANEDNTKVPVNYLSEEDDALTQSWYGICWMNPPYNDKKKWIIKAYNESLKPGCIVVCLVPARTNTTWWHDYCMKGEIRFIKGRPIFEGMTHGLPQPLAIVIFGSDYNNRTNYKSVVLNGK